MREKEIREDMEIHVDMASLILLTKNGYKFT